MNFLLNKSESTERQTVHYDHAPTNAKNPTDAVSESTERQKVHYDR